MNHACTVLSYHTAKKMTPEHRVFSITIWLQFVRTLPITSYVIALQRLISRRLETAHQSREASSRSTAVSQAGATYNQMMRCIDTNLSADAKWSIPVTHTSAVTRLQCVSEQISYQWLVTWHHQLILVLSADWNELRPSVPLVLDAGH